MKTESYKGTIETAYNQKLDTPVKFEGTFEAFSDYEELVKANELPSNAEVLKFVNDKRKANARQKAMTSALEAAGIVKPTVETSEELRIKNIVESILASPKGKSMSREQAEEQARLVLGI